MNAESRGALRELKTLLGPDDYRMAVAYFKALAHFKVLEKTTPDCPLRFECLTPAECKRNGCAFKDAA